MSSPNPRLTVPEMRRRFNEGKYWERMKAGEFLPVLIRRGTPQRDVLEKWPEARSEYWSWRDGDGFEVARVHQYALPNGTIVASGRPDPKRLFEDGVVYHLEKRQQSL